jgi:hypothetical protein
MQGRSWPPRFVGCAQTFVNRFNKHRRETKRCIAVKRREAGNGQLGEIPSTYSKQALPPVERRPDGC